MDSHEHKSENSPNSAPPSSVMDVVAPPPVPSKPESTPSKQHEEQHHVVTKANAPTAGTEEKSGGVGFAIFATVVIVLGLAALATYAYIKTAN